MLRAICVFIGGVLGAVLGAAPFLLYMAAFADYWPLESEAAGAFVFFAITVPIIAAVVGSVSTYECVSAAATRRDDRDRRDAELARIEANREHELTRLREQQDHEQAMLKMKLDAGYGPDGVYDGNDDDEEEERPTKKPTKAELGRDDDEDEEDDDYDEEDDDYDDDQDVDEDDDDEEDEEDEEEFEENEEDRPTPKNRRRKFKLRSAADAAKEQQSEMIRQAVEEAVRRTVSTIGTSMPLPAGRVEHIPTVFPAAASDRVNIPEERLSKLEAQLADFMAKEDRV